MVKDHQGVLKVRWRQLWWCSDVKKVTILDYWTLSRSGRVCNICSIIGLSLSCVCDVKSSVLCDQWVVILVIRGRGQGCRQLSGDTAAAISFLSRTCWFCVTRIHAINCCCLLNTQNVSCLNVTFSRSRIPTALMLTLWGRRVWTRV